MVVAFVSAKLVSMQKYSAFYLLYQAICENGTMVFFSIHNVDYVLR